VFWRCGGGGETGSLYKPVERAPRVFNPLKVPAKLQATLPFLTKPKVVSWGLFAVCPLHCTALGKGLCFTLACAYPLCALAKPLCPCPRCPP
jgi:hypothetical protein